MTHKKYRRWPLNAPAFILDTLLSKARTVFQDNSIKLTNFEINFDLGNELVLTAVRRKYSQSNGWKIFVINKGRYVLGITKVSTSPQPENFKLTSGRCFKCVEAIVGKKSFKAQREKLNNKLKAKH